MVHLRLVASARRAEAVSAAARSVVARLGTKISTVEQRFWPKVARGGAEDGCWEWAATRNGKGYGQIDKVGAHRVSYWLATGVDPIEMSVCHRCDNPPCVRPSHLFLGTHADNMADAKRKKRLPSRPKLSDQQVAEIRELYAHGMTGPKIAVLFGISHQQAGRLIAGTSRTSEPVTPGWRTAGYATPNSRLTIAEEDEIRRIYATGTTSQRRLAAQFGIPHPTIQDILGRKAS